MSDDIKPAALTGGDDAEDDRLLLELRALAIEDDPVPLEALAAARSAIAWRTMDAELAELTADTSVEPQLAGVRSADAPTLLSFDGPTITVEVEIIQGAGSRRILGQLVPAAPATVEIRHRGGRSEATADEIGRFSASGIAPGPVSLRCEVGEQVVETDWFLA